MKRISYWVFSTVAAFVLLFTFDASQRGSGGAADPAALSGTTGTSTDAGAGNGSTTSGGTGRTVTGSVAQTQWGPVQVQLTVRNGSITQVTVPQYPSSNGRDVEIANFSLPTLIQETIKSQSADIDMVSGATYTSDGYIRSLQSALDRADL